MTDSALILARDTVRMLRARIASNERLIRCYLMEIQELQDMIEGLEREMTRADIHETIRRDSRLSPPVLRRQQAGPLRDITNLMQN